MRYDKILLAYRDDKGNYHGETVRVIKEGEYYRIRDIPFYTENIAFNDLVSVEKKEDILLFYKIMEESGNSVVQMIIFNENQVPGVGKELKKQGCNWVVGEQKDLIAVDIPKEVAYAPVKVWLEKGFESDRWDYKEACMSHKY